ncbi:radical SAM family heme chaperone HemW [Ancylobacter sp.]|uniref:radical SAM family heme chaperone HemW n=1 Tax=Ancylobacter sp. TaxID=1872567 RepID=UPI003D0C9702
MTERAPAPPPVDPGFGVYVHWPFCKAKCPYCDFNSHVRHAPPDQARFVAAFKAEIAHTRIRIGQRRTHSVFFGGGTPSLMEPGTVGAILDAIDAAWPLDAGAEVTLEANPTSVEAGRFRGYRAAGVNRVSLGVQALDDASLRALGRMHTAQEALGAVAVARAAFERVSFDLIYARPGQKPEDWARELGRAIDEGCEHLSLYQLTIEDGTPFAALHRAGKLIVPEDDVSRALWDVTQETTRAAGLPGYEVSNHARPGAESRHNLLYWRYGEYAGIGPGAHGRLDTPEGRVATSTERGPEDWVGRVEAAGHGVTVDEALSRTEQADEYLLMGLRLLEGIDTGRFARLAGRPFDPARVAALLQDGMIEQLPDERLRATALGLPVLDAIVADLAA